MERRKKRRHKAGFGYIGAGNSLDVFNRKPKSAFSDFKDPLNYESLKLYSNEFTSKEITAKERFKIKNNIRKNNTFKSIKIALWTLIITSILIIIAIKMLEGALYRSL